MGTAPFINSAILTSPSPPAPMATGIPQAYNNGVTAPDDAVSQQQHQSSSVIIATIIVASAIIVSASVYLLLRCLSRRCNRSLPADDVVSDNRNEDEHVRHHVVCFGNNGGADSLPSLPLFTFSSLTGKIAGGDCAVCLSKFEGVDQLRLLPLCCHAFHAQCIDVWLKSNLTCPLCRSPVNFTDADILNKIATERVTGDRSNSFRIEIGSISRRRETSESGRRSYSIGSYEYVLDEDGYEISVESTHRSTISVDKDSTTLEPAGENLASEVAPGGGSGRCNWLRDYVDRVSDSLSSRTQSFRSSGRFFTGSSRRSDTVDFEATHGRIGEEISELFRWLSGV